MNLLQALDLMHLNARSDNEDGLELAEDLINTTLKYVASDQDSTSSLSADDKKDILSDHLVETFVDRLT